MNCIFHIQNPIISICIASHKCMYQRKLCFECFYDHGVDIKQAIPINKFQEMAMNKLKESKLDQTDEITAQRMAFKSMLSKTQSMLIRILDDLSESYKSIFDRIEIQDKLYQQFINKEINVADLTNSDLEMLVQIIEGKKLNDWNMLKKFYIMELENTQNLLEKEIKALIEKSNEEIKKISSLVKVQSSSEYQVHQQRQQSRTTSSQKENFKWNNMKINQLMKIEPNSGYVESVCISPDGTTLVSGSQDKSIRLWDIKTGKLKAKLDGHSSSVRSVCFSPDGTTLASGSGEDSVFFPDNQIRLWDAKTRKQKAKLKGHTSYVHQVCFSPDGNTLASGSHDKSIRLWDVKTEQQIAKLDGHSNYVLSVCFSPDGSTLATASADNSIRLWEVKTQYQQAKLEGHNEWVFSVCFSPDGSTLASCSRDSSVRLWNPKTYQQKAILSGHNMTVFSVQFSPDGNILASGSYDRSICIWDAKTLQLIHQLNGHMNRVLQVCFSPVDSILASSSEDNSICLWGPE